MRLCRDSRFNIDPIGAEELRRVVKSPRSPASLFKRARAVLLLGEKLGPSEVARRAGLGRANVYIWAQRFYEYGIAGLKDLPRRRKPRAVVVTACHFEPVVSPGDTQNASLSRQIGLEA